METRTEIVQELHAISPLLASLPDVNVYTVPDDFFVSFPEQMAEKIRLNTLLEAASGHTFQIPESYFDQLPQQILARLRSAEVSEELADTAPLLNTVSREQTYSIPETYFERIDFVPATKKAAAEGKVITLRIARKWMQYAAAAVVTGILVTGAFLFTDDSSNYIESEKIEKADVSSSLDKVTEQELVTYLESHEHLLAAQATISLTSEDELKEVKDNIRQVSDEELNQYLNENGETLEVQVSARSK